MAVVKAEKVPVRQDQDIVSARQLVRQAMQEAGFSLVEQTKMVTAASELARNTVKYGLGGTMTLEVLREGTKTGLRVTFEDEGPGIPDLSLAMRDGWSTGGGLGMGLPGAKRLVNEFEITSIPQNGTRVSIARWR